MRRAETQSNFRLNYVKLLFLNTGNVDANVVDANQSGGKICLLQITLLQFSENRVVCFVTLVESIDLPKEVAICS